MKKLILKTSFFSVFIIISNFAYSTHIIGGEIRANRTSETQYTYSISLVLYSDDTSPVPAGSGIINFGDGSGDYNLADVMTSSTKEELSGDRSRTIFLIDHTFSTPGTFAISFKEFNRTPNFINMSNSVNTPFYIESKVVIDPYVGKNSSAELRSIPLFDGRVGSIYTEKPEAFDADGDSLALKLIVPRQSEGEAVNDYKFPNEYKDINSAASNSDGSYFPAFTFDSENDVLFWDAPVLPGVYSIAYVVEEWRRLDDQWHFLGSSTRDYVVEVEDIANRRPFIKVPNDITIRAGEPFTLDIPVGDSDGDEFVIESTGIPYELDVQPALYILDENTVRFSWQPDDSHIKDEPYKIVFRITDRPSSDSKLYDYKEWNVTVTTLTSTATEDPLPSEKITIFPNPSQGKIKIKKESGFNLPATIYVYNQLGMQLMTRTYTEFDEEITIDLSTYRAGIYLLRYQTPLHKISKKLILID